MLGFNFLKYPVYLDAKSLCISLDSLCRKLKNEHKYTYADQLTRAKLSVVLNIAEGFSRYTKADFCRFMAIATGSLYEVVACLDIMCEFDYLTLEEKRSYYLKAVNVAKQLSTLRKGTR